MRFARVAQVSARGLTIAKAEVLNIKPYKVYNGGKLLSEWETEVLACESAKEASENNVYTFITVVYQVSETLAHFDNGVDLFECYRA